MEEKCFSQYICLKNQLADEDFEKIRELSDICMKFDKVSLKLELEYKMSIRRGESSPLKAVNEFLYFAGDMAIGYLGISHFGGSEAEINGMVHPDWRRKGIFTRLYQLAKEECSKRGFEGILLLCDIKSESAVKFIESTRAKYGFSEYKMKLVGRVDITEGNSLTVRKASNWDGEVIGRMDSIFFGTPDILMAYPEEEEQSNRITYMFELNGRAIGKIKVVYDENSSYIYGFGIIPEYRGKGYGREALASILKTIRMRSPGNIYLDVASENDRALNLYKSCGFVPESVIKYYKA